MTSKRYILVDPFKGEVTDALFPGGDFLDWVRATCSYEWVEVIPIGTNGVVFFVDEEGTHKERQAFTQLNLVIGQINVAGKFLVGYQLKDKYQGLEMDFDVAKVQRCVTGFMTPEPVTLN